MTDKPEFWGRKTFCLITGASQGIGRQISIDFAKKVGSGSTFLLLARNLENLNETKALMERNAPSCSIITHSVNLSEPIGSELRKIINMALMTSGTEPDVFDLALVVHNAGSLGDASENAYEMKDLEKLNAYFTLNLYAAMILNSEFLKIFDVKKREGDLDHSADDLVQKTEIAILNITSLCGIKPVAYMGYYCMGKSCREMYFGVLSEENPGYTVLNYSPGPVLTEMTDEIISTIGNTEMKDVFVKMKAEATILSPEVSIGKLVEVLAGGKFKNGGRVDFFDV